MIDGLSSVMLKRLGREFYATPPTDPETRTFAYAGEGSFYFPRFEIRSIDTVALDGIDLVEWQTYLPDPLEQTDEGTYFGLHLPQATWNQNQRLPYWHISRFSKLEVTGLWGAAVPLGVEDALWVAVAEQFRNKSGAQQVHLGQITYVDTPDVNAVWTLSPNVLRLLAPFARQHTG